MTGKLRSLASWGAHFAQFKTYFLLIAERIDIKRASASSALGAPVGTDVQYQAYNLQNCDGCIAVRYESELKDNAAFSSVEHNPDFDPNNAIFVRSNTGDLLPDAVVQIQEAGFINGLITRLYLGEFLRHTKLNKNINLDIGDPSQPFGPGHNPFEKAANWTKDGFSKSLENLLHKNPVQSNAMLMGWYAGQLLDAAQPKYRQAVWGLLRYRVGFRGIGTAISYTLNYMAGVQRNNEIIHAAQAANSPSPAPANDSVLLDQLANTERTDEHNRLNGHIIAQTVFDAMLAENARTSLAPIKPQDQQKLLTQEQAFLSGFEAGSIMSANDVYVDVFHLAFGLGYTDGFRNGYEKGFAEGARVGYQRGWADASSPWNGFDGVVHFVQQVATVYNVGQTIIGAIASLF